ncbi:DUF2157 domain-containing protein [Halanaerobium salsuginis]|jgi:hypothetical protein|uniref:Predicted membrane protein n=1 Tax=Halanaerobium salsuginis TaxID=29563 RepID=A0A1I4MY15_9FIRM|nr:DUF2157 domain-containing protein [Halanaerobium salsuginis]SFM07903.1 Predicted membrane protein [Halanaerobium salsuginis]
MAKKDKIILNELDDWYQHDLIEKNLYNNLASLYQRESWDFNTIIRWTLIIGAIMIGIGLISFITFLIQSIYFVILALSVLCFIAYYYGFKLRKKDFKHYYPRTGNALIAVASLLINADIFAINSLIFTNEVHWTSILVLVTLVYFVIAYLNKNTLVLVFALTSAAISFGAKTGYVSGWGLYFLGLSYPMRFVVISPLVALLGYLHTRTDFSIPESFVQTYYAFGLLFLNLSLWILSIIGYHGNLFKWGYTNDNWELLFFSLLWAAADIIIFLIGTRFKQKIFVRYAITFLILNLYTRYFEYFWDKMYKSLFFIILGLISVSIGLYLEKKLNKKA